MTVMFLALAVLLGAARTLGEISRRLGQPAVLGEILAGVLLGPSILGNIAPDWERYLYPGSGNSRILLDGITSLAVAFFLMVAGMEVDLSMARKRSRPAALLGMASLVVPFLLSFLAARYLLRSIGYEPPVHDGIFSLFFATALSISALPVIARLLMDLDLYHGEFGITVLSAAVLNDLVGWVIFALVVGSMENRSGAGMIITILLILIFILLMLTLGRRTVHLLLPWIESRAEGTGPTGAVLGFVLAMGLLSAAFTEWIGIHAIFGAFVAGIITGDAPGFRRETKAVVHEFVSSLFAPIFFAGIGLRIDFPGSFDLNLTLFVLILAIVGKLGGSYLGAMLGGMGKRERWAAGFSLNARGAMEIVLGLLALQYGLIREKMFVSLVTMAFLTTLMGGPLIRRLMPSTETGEDHSGLP